MKKNFLFAFYVISGIVIGSLLAALGHSVRWLSFLAFGTTIGFGAGDPALLDLSVLKVWFGFSFELTVAHIITIGLALWLYYRKKRR